MTNPSKDKLPRHIAIIMDGNGRWARKRFLNRINGHRKGVEVARDIVKFSRELGMENLTLYTFSKENWNRPAREVQMLMKILENHLKGEADTLIKNNIRFRAIGNISDLPASIMAIIADLEATTSRNDGMVLNLALSYSGREEITAAARTLAKRAAEGELDPEDITEDMLQQCLYTAGTPDPDLLIRTSGEKRISNFLLWQLAYTEIYITDVLWPDFTREHFMEAILDYQTRERRFGLIKEEVTDAASKSIGGKFKKVFL